MDSLPSLYLWKVRPFSWTNSYILELTEALDGVLIPKIFSREMQWMVPMTDVSEPETLLPSPS